VKEKKKGRQGWIVSDRHRHPLVKREEKEKNDLLSTFLFACAERSDDKLVWSIVVLPKQNNVPLVVWPLAWLF
jgi:hypothetical protein